MTSSNMEFSISKCVDGIYPNVKCKSPEQIYEFIKDLEINMWKIEEKIDFSDYNDPPTFERMKPMLSDYLSTR